MRYRIVILSNGTREEACSIFDATKRSMTDFKKESVSIVGNVRNVNEGWSVIKTKF